MPSGTTHSFKGNGMAAVAPPTSIWQKRPSGERSFKGSAEKVNKVPGPTEPVLVTDKVGLATEDNGQLPCCKIK